MTKPLPFTQANITRAVSAARKAGLRVVSIDAKTGVIQVAENTAPTLALGEVVTQTVPPADDKAWDDVA